MRIRIFINWKEKWECNGSEGDLMLQLSEYLMPSILEEIKKGNHITMYCPEEAGKKK